jgi:hypothetical protein
MGKKLLFGGNGFLRLPVEKRIIISNTCCGFEIEIRIVLIYSLESHNPNNS